VKLACHALRIILTWPIAVPAAVPAQPHGPECGDAHTKLAVFQLSSLSHTLLQILRKRPSQDEQNKRKSMRARGRRVSFAPDDELETRHLFSIVSM